MNDERIPQKVRFIFIGIIVILFGLAVVFADYTPDNYNNVQSTLTADYTPDSYNNIQSVFGSDESPAIIVTANSPVDYYNTTDTTPDFAFTTTGKNTNTSCHLYINTTMYGMNTTVYNNTQTTITANATVTEGYHSWYITCTQLGISASSTTRYFTVDTSGPTCALVSRTPTDIEANTTGDFSIEFQCNDTTGINTSRFMIARTVEGGIDVGIPNFWSIRPPSHDEAISNITIVNETILKADGRWDEKWYDFAGIDGMADNHSYAAQDNSSIRVTITPSGTTAIINYTWKVEPSAFRNSVFLSRGMIEMEEKNDYEIYKDNGLLVKYWDLESMRDTTNYSIWAFRNLNYTGTPNKGLRIFYCNSTYDYTSGTAPDDDDTNCVYVNELDTTDVTTIVFESRNSTYSSAPYGVVNGELGGIKATDHYYVYYYSDAPSPVGKYLFRYANDSSGTNTSFADTNVAWITTDGGTTFQQANFTPDAWFTAIKSGDQFQIGVYVEDSLSDTNNYTNFSIVKDDIGDVDFRISSPSIDAYMQGYNIPHNGDDDKDLNGTYYDWMTIHVHVAIDPDGIPVNHSVYLFNTDGTFNITMNNSFSSADQSDVHISFNTSTVPDGTYKMNVTARQSPYFESFLTDANFTINQSTRPMVITLNSPDDASQTSDTTPDFNFTVTGFYNSAYCELFINSTGYGYNATTYNETQTVITANTSLTLNTYSWQIKCDDLSRTYTNSSEVRTVTILEPDMQLQFSGVYCYQETANETSTCGGVASGSYEWNATWEASHPISYAYDGNDGSWAEVNGSIIGAFFVNYTKPSTITSHSRNYVPNKGSYWRVSDTYQSWVNLSLPDPCWAQSPLQFRVISDGVNDDVYWDCWQGYEWLNLRTNTITSLIVEEAMYWHAGADSLMFDVNLFTDEIINATYQNGTKHVLRFYNNGTYIGYPKCKLNETLHGATLEMSVSWNFDCVNVGCINLTTNYQNLLTTGPVNLTLNSGATIDIYAREYHNSTMTGGYNALICDITLEE